MGYAKTTDVSSDRSKAEIERTLVRYGASRFGYMWEAGSAVVIFEYRKRTIKFVVPMPTPAEYELTPSGRQRSEQSQQEAYEQAQRQRWRALLLVIKAKLEAVETGITTLEAEFMANTVTRDGRTVFEHVEPEIQRMITSGEQPRFLMLQAPREAEKR
jgi:hypothetical protein